MKLIVQRPSRALGVLDSYSQGYAMLFSEPFAEIISVITKFFEEHPWRCCIRHTLFARTGIAMVDFNNVQEAQSLSRP